MERILKYLSDLMKKIPDGFPRQRLTRLPAEALCRCKNTALIKDIYVTDIGHFPATSGHFVDRPKGCSSNILIFCTTGHGWVSMRGMRRKPVLPGSVVCIPVGIPHRYGGSENNPWQIHWVHFRGSKSGSYLARLGTGLAGEVTPVESGAIIDTFEEAHAALGGDYSESSLLVLSATLSRLLALIIRARQAPGRKSRQTSQRITQSMRWLREHLAEPLTLPRLATKAGLSVPHYCALFKKQTGQSPMRYLTEARMSVACRLLDSTEMPVSEIAQATGFGDPFHFSRTFRSVVGTSPRAYRAEGTALFP